MKVLKRVIYRKAEKLMMNNLDSKKNDFKKRFSCPFPYWTYEPVHPSKKSENKTT